VTIAASDVIIDACTLVNFSVVGRMDLLQERFSGHAHWTVAIQHEATRLHVEDTDWLGPPIDVSSDGVIAIIKVEQIREELGATSTEPATLHLGEAEAIYYIETHEPSWAFLSDDGPAADYAQNRGLQAALSEEVLADSYECSLIGCPGAFELLQQMEAAGRGVRVPPSHWYVCPPRSADPAISRATPESKSAAGS
jgi:predicted nucleic acid-binding protein